VNRRWSTELNQLAEVNRKQLADVLSDASRPLCSVYGAVVGLLAFGLDVCQHVVFIIHLSTSALQWSWFFSVIAA